MRYAFLFMAIFIFVWIICSTITKQQDNRDFFAMESTNAMKGVAILSVVLCHFMGRFGGGITIFTPLGGIGVSIFLILSAYGLNESWNRLGGHCWWRKRIIAVVIPYAVLQSMLYWPFHEFALKDFVLDIFCIKPMYDNGWYLSYLFSWYILFYVIERVISDRKKKPITFLIVSIVMFIIDTFVKGSSIRAEQSMSFVFGIWLSEMKETKMMDKIINWKMTVIVLFTGIAFLGLKQCSVIRESYDYIFNLVQLLIKLPIGFGLMQLIWFVSKRINTRIFSYIGLFGFELYLAHGYAFGKVPITFGGAISFIVIAFSGAITYYLLWRRGKVFMRKLLRVV